MIKIKNKKTCSLSPTSAMVLVWLGPDFYTHNNTLQYLDTLDLTEGKKVAKEFKSIWSFYDEIMKNRKFIIKHLAFDFLSQNTNTQLVILAAGLDPLSIEISSHFPQTKIFDVDMDNMRIKKDLVSQITNLNNIQFITTDITCSQKLKNSLVQSGWRPSASTLVVAEGISYYISKKFFWNAVECFTSSQNINAFIMDYILPLHLVDDKFRDISEQTFQKLANIFALKNISEYTEENITEYLSKINGVVTKTWSFMDMEKQRINKQKLFYKKEEGWIQISYCKI